MTNCRGCKHYRPGAVVDNGHPTCAAFPDGIPLDIWFAQRDHFSPIEGDHGIQFQSWLDTDQDTPVTDFIRAISQ